MTSTQSSLAHDGDSIIFTHYHVAHDREDDSAFFAGFSAELLRQAIPKLRESEPYELVEGETSLTITPSKQSGQYTLYFKIHSDGINSSAMPACREVSLTELESLVQNSKAKISLAA